MTKFDNDEVAAFDQVGDVVEAAFAGVAAGGAAGESFVDDGDFEGVLEILAPACRVVRLDSLAVEQMGGSTLSA